MHDRHLQNRGAAGSLAAIAILAATSLSGAAEKPSIFTAAGAALTKGPLAQTRVLGCYDSKREFTELPDEGAVLVGLECGVGKFMNIETVYALRPIYQTAGGEVAYADHGPFVNRRVSPKKVIKTRVRRIVQVHAEPGYAVGGVTIRSGLNINGLSVRFMRIKGTTLDPDEAYTSEWVGDRTGGGEAYISGDGAPVVGIRGSQDDDHIQAFGLIYIDESAALRAPAERAAPPPPAEQPVPRPPLTRPVEQPPQEPVDRPAAEPEAEPPAEPVQKEEPVPPVELAKPLAVVAAKKVPEGTPKQTAGSTETGLTVWVLVCVVVAVPLFVVLWVINKVAQATCGRTQSESSEETADAAAVPPANSSALCERPREQSGLGPQPVGTEDLQSIPMVEPLSPDEVRAERPQPRPRLPEEIPALPINLPSHQPVVKAPGRSFPLVAANIGMVLCFALFSAAAPYLFPSTGGINFEQVFFAGVAAAVGRGAGWLVGKFIDELRRQRGGGDL